MKDCNCNTPKNKPVCKKTDGLTIIVIPAQLGGSAEGELYAPKTGEHKNTIVKYLADGLVYAYDKKGVWTLIADSRMKNIVIDEALDITSNHAIANRVVTAALNELTSQIESETARAESAESALQSNIDAEAATRAAEDVAIRADLANEIAQETADIRQVQEELNRDFVNDLEMETNAQSVTFIEDKVNPYTGSVSQERDTIPTASATTAGTMSAAEFISITDSQQRLDALENGAVAISGLSENPTQEELTTAWLNATQREGLINRAGIYDIDNTKSWTYYTNVSMWEAVTAGAVTINQFTNSTAGTIKGSTTTGNVSANADGTGSVAGWAELNNTVASKANATDVPTNTEFEDALQTKQNTLVSGTSIKTINDESLLGSGNITISADTVLVTFTNSRTWTSTENLQQSVTNRKSIAIGSSDGTEFYMPEEITVGSSYIDMRVKLGDSGERPYHIRFNNPDSTSGTRTVTLDPPFLTDSTGSVTSDNIDWATLDTGWIDCPYASGYTTSSNTGWKRLQARVIYDQLYLRGGVSRTSGNFATSQAHVATLPEEIFTRLTTTSNINAVGRASGNLMSIWTVFIVGDEQGRDGQIHLFPSGANTTWCSPPGCMGLVN